MAKRQPDNLTEPFVISDRIRELAKEKGWPNPEAELDKFIAYHEMTGWTLKSGRKIVDRDAAFRYWLSNAKDYGRGPKPFIPERRPEPIKREVMEQRWAHDGPSLLELVKGMDVRKGKA